MILLDIEGTIIDDLWNRNWENENISAIKNWITSDHSDEKTFSIFTFGWLNHSDIDWALIHLIENKLELRCKDVFVKADVLNECLHFKAEFTPQDEIDANDALGKMLNKEFGAEKLFKYFGDLEVNFVDDTIQSKTIQFGSPMKLRRDTLNFFIVADIREVF